MWLDPLPHADDDDSAAGGLGRSPLGNHPFAVPQVEPAEEDDEYLSSIVCQAQQGDEEAFRVLYRAVQPRILRYLRILVGQDADDVASEAWLQIARDMTSFHGDADGFRGWATTIARNRAMDHLRHHRRRPSDPVPDEDFADLPGEADTEALALDEVATDAAIALIATLPRDQAEAIVLRVVIGLDAESAGHVLGKRAGAIRTSAYRGLKKLAKHLERPGTWPPTGLPPRVR